MSLKRVNGHGPKDAKIAIVGEAPGAEEELQGIPFVGSSGRLLDICLSNAGIRRSDCYVTNVVKVRPPHNDLTRVEELGVTVESFYPELFKELSEVKPNVIIALGNTALTALCGEFSVMKWRGSVLMSTIGIKTIPSIHPAACLREWVNVYIMTFDFKKALRESKTADLVRVERSYKTDPTFEEVCSYLELFKHIKYLSIDIETYMRSGITRCIAFAFTIDAAFCIPILKDMKPVWSIEEEKYIWKELFYILTANHIKRIGQNNCFELSQLKPFTSGQMSFNMDTLRAHALVFPELKHSLAFMTSIYTDMPYYKDDGKISDDKGRNYKQLQEYNCKDVCSTLEIAFKLTEELKEINMYEFYHEYDMPLMMCLWRMQERGMKIDLLRLEYHKVKVKEDIERLTAELTAEVGYALNVESSKQMKQYLYNELNLPKQHKKDKHGLNVLTANEDALTELYRKNPHIKSLSLVLSIRKLRTIDETFLDMKLSPDNRIRTSYGLTETGRLSSRKDLFGVGANIQNIPKEKGKWVREIFIPDEGKILVKADLSQAEARVVAWLSRDPNYINMFKTGKDIHKQYASMLFKEPYESITDSQRDKAKKLRHAKNYNMGPVSLAKHMSITTAEAKLLIFKDDKLFPNIRGVFYREVEEQLNRNRTLTTPFGRKRTFFGRWNDSLLREAYAYIPQSTVADYLNRGLIELEIVLPEGVDLLLQVHDEIVLQCLPEQLDIVCSLMKKHLERTIYIHNEPLIIPAEISHGKNWADTIPYKP